MTQIQLMVDGMTCHNCVAHVTAELAELAGVEDVTVTLGSPSKVTVVSNKPITDDELREAVDEAGDYELVNIVRD